MPKTLKIALKHLMIIACLLGSNLSSATYGVQKESQKKEKIINKQKSEATITLTKWIKQHAKSLVSTTIFLVAGVTFFSLKIIKKSQKTIEEKSQKTIEEERQKTIANKLPASLPPITIEEKRQKALTMFKEEIHYEELLYTEILGEAYNNKKILQAFPKIDQESLKLRMELWGKVKETEEYLLNMKEEDLKTKTIEEIFDESKQLLAEGKGLIHLRGTDLSADSAISLKEDILKAYNTVIKMHLNTVSRNIRNQAADVIKSNPSFQEHYKKKIQYLEEALARRMYDVSKSVWHLIEKNIEEIYENAAELIAGKLKKDKWMIDQEALKMAMYVPILGWNIKAIIKIIKQKARKKSFIVPFLNPITGENGKYRIDCFTKAKKSMQNYIDKCCENFTEIYLIDFFAYQLSWATSSFKPIETIPYDPALHMIDVNADINEIKEEDFTVYLNKIISFEKKRVNDSGQIPFKTRVVLWNTKKNKLFKESGTSRSAWGITSKDSSKKKKLTRRTKWD